MKKVLLAIIFSITWQSSGNAQFLQMQSFKIISITSQTLSSGGGGGGGTCGGNVTIPTGTIAIFCLNEGSGLSIAEVNYSTRVGVLAGDTASINWISTAGARGIAAPSTRPTTGYISIPEESWMSLHAGDASTGQQTVMMCVEPRQASSVDGFWSMENNSGTKYAYVIMRNANDTVSSRLSSSVGAGVSTMVSSAGVLNTGMRNSIVARIDKTQTLALSNRLFVNSNLMSGDATGGLATTTHPTGIDLRFGNQGSDPTGSWSDSNLSFYVYLERNVTQAEINTFHADCAALTP